MVTDMPDGTRSDAPAHPDVGRVYRAVSEVADPELPEVTLGMLGMIHEVAVDTTGTARVVLLPTYSGCPAIEMIEHDVVDVVRALEGITGVVVLFTFDPPWSPDRIDATGRERLRSFGIAPPGGPLPQAVTPAGRRTLPLAVDATTSATSRSMHATPSSTTAPSDARRPPARHPTPAICPYCGSDDTRRDSPYGPTPCRDLRMCHACVQPYEAFKPG